MCGFEYPNAEHGWRKYGPEGLDARQLALCCMMLLVNDSFPFCCFEICRTTLKDDDDDAPCIALTENNDKGCETLAMQG